MPLARPFRNRLLALLAAASLTVPLAAVPSAAAQAAAPTEAAPHGLALDGLGGGPYTVTLVTGDRVTLTPGPDGRFSIDAVPAPRPDGSVPDLHYTSFGRRDAVYVVSHDVMEQVQAGRVDRELFNVAYLAANGHADNAAKRTPVIVEYAGEPSPSALRGKPRELAATGDAVALESIGAAATTVDKARAADFWKSVVGDQPAAQSLQGGIERLWLDSVVRVTLEDSVPQVGAPQAWQAGLDGEGVKVAVLDTGIDESHPDVAGKIIASKSFIPDQEVKDGHGHGTHVAATVAGSGAASDGRRKGVAPGADLIVGKVLADSGSSTSSSLIEGMEWAAGEMDADVVSLSLGGPPSDGKDPLSQAVNGLTESTGALFVIAAGNSGREFTIATPGSANAALTVGAVDKRDKLAGFSSRGPRLGDYAIKPEITAPGAAIVAARAAGTSLGDPVDEHYTSASGTSMATPHVSGAAAILLQQHPGWTPAQVKAALTASAQDVGATVYQQGAGRLDVARAIGQNVQAGQATASFGFHRLPIEGGPLSRTLSYTNSGDQPVTLSLTATARTDKGEPMPEEALTLDRDDVTLPAGGTAQVTLTLDHRDLTAAVYTGSMVAATSDGAVRLTTPIGAVLGAQLHELTVRMIHSDNPRGWKKDSLSPPIVYVAPIEGAERQADWIRIGGPRSTVDWEKGAKVQIPAGTYTVFTPLSETWIDDTGAHQEVRMIDPEVSVPSDTEVVLDAAKAVRVTYDTPRPSEGHNRATMFIRWVPEDVAKRGFFVSWGDIALTTNARRDNLWVTPTERVTKGEFTFATQNTRVAPALTMTLQGRKPERLDAQYPIFGASVGGGTYAPDPSKMFSGKRTLPLVDVGFGTPEELAAADVRGKLAMVRRDPAALNSILHWQCWPEEPAFRALIDAGAAGIVVGQNEYRDYPGPAEHYMRCGVPGLNGAVAPATFLRTMVNELPIVFVPFADADRLRARAAAGEVRITVEGTPRTPYTYQLKPYEEGRIPDRLHYDFSKRKLATVEHELHGSGWRAITFSAWKPYEPAVADNRGAQSLPPFAPAPWQFTEYLGPVASDTVVRHAVGEAGWQAPRQLRYDRFDRPGRTKVAWDDGPKVPAVAPPLVGTVPDGYPGFIPSDVGLCSGCREGDVFWPSLRYSTSPDPHQIGQDPRTQFGQHFGDEKVRLERADGMEVPQVADPYAGDLLGYRLPPEPGRYRLTHQFDQTTTTWTFTSQTVKKDRIADGYRCTGTWLEHWGNFPPTETPCRPEPLIFLRYDLGLDLSGQVAAGRKHRFTVTAHRQPGKGDTPEVTGLELQVSYDGGSTWTKAKVRPHRKGEFTAEVRHPGTATGPVSVRAEAWDRAGNRVAQTITAAFTLKK